MKSFSYNYLIKLYLYNDYAYFKLLRDIVFIQTRTPNHLNRDSEHLTLWAHIPNTFL